MDRYERWAADPRTDMPSMLQAGETGARGVLVAYIYSKELRRRIMAGNEPAWLRRHPRRTYIVNITLATPDWVDRAEMRRIVERSRRRVDCVRDHIVPLTHPLVCGLNVPWNLRIIPRLENAQRSNRWWEYTADMFSEPEQLRLV